MVLDGFSPNASWKLPLRNTRKIQVDLYIYILESAGKNAKGTIGPIDGFFGIDPNLLILPSKNVFFFS